MLLEHVLVYIFSCEFCGTWHQASAHMKWALVSCTTCFSKVNLKKQGWSVQLQTESWDKPVSEMKENVARLSEFLPFICVLCPQYIPVKLWIEMGIKSYTILCFLFILEGRTSYNLFFAYITRHCISLFIFLNTESDCDFYLGLHFCEGSKLLSVFNHWPCYILYSCCGCGKHLSKLQHIHCGVLGLWIGCFWTGVSVSAKWRGLLLPLLMPTSGDSSHRNTVSDMGLWVHGVFFSVVEFMKIIFKTRKAEINSRPLCYISKSWVYCVRQTGQR